MAGVTRKGAVCKVCNGTNDGSKGCCKGPANVSAAANARSIDTALAAEGVTPGPAVAAETRRRREFLTHALTSIDPHRGSQPDGFHSMLFDPENGANAKVLDYDPDLNIGVARLENSGGFIAFGLDPNSRRWRTERARFEYTVERYHIDSVADEGAVWADIDAKTAPPTRRLRVAADQPRGTRDLGTGPDVACHPATMETARTRGMTDDHLATAGYVAARTGNCRSNYVTARAIGDTHQQACHALETFTPERIDRYFAAREGGLAADAVRAAEHRRIEARIEADLSAEG